MSFNTYSFGEQIIKRSAHPGLISLLPYWAGHAPKYLRLAQASHLSSLLLLTDDLEIHSSGCMHRLCVSFGTGLIVCP